MTVLQKTLHIFDTALKTQQRIWAARQSGFADAMLLRNEVGSRIVECVKDLKSMPQHVLVFGAPCTQITSNLADNFGIRCTIVDHAPLEGVDICLDPLAASAQQLSGAIQAKCIQAPDAAISNMHLHWTNDPQDHCRALKLSVKPNSPVIGALLGGDTLYELRSALVQAQSRILGGVSPLVAPMMHARDVAALLLHSGLSGVAVHIDEIALVYSNMRALLSDLQLMGESSAIASRRPCMRRDVLRAAESIYKLDFGNESAHLKENGIRATFQVISFIGWT